MGYNKGIGKQERESGRHTMFKTNEITEEVEARICDSCDDLTEDFVEENGLSLCQFCKS